MIMMKKNRRLIQVLILSTVVVITAITIAGNLFSEKDELPTEGSKAPNFALRTLDGGHHQLKDFEGHPVIINFWGTFCEPCVNEMPLIQSYYETYKDQGLVVLGINLNEAEATVRAFVREHGITFPILMDNDRIRRNYGVMYYPTTFFVGPDGVIQDIFIGELKDSTLSVRVNRLLSSNG